MAERRKLEVGNNTIETGGDFAEEYANGYLYYYDTNRQLARPFTDVTICRFMTENLMVVQRSKNLEVSGMFYPSQGAKGTYDNKEK